MLDTPRLLARDSTREHYLGTGYTNEPAKALRDEPEAISVDDQLLMTARSERAARDTQRIEWDERQAAIQREVDWLYSQRFAQPVGKPLRNLRRQLAALDKLIAQ